MPLFSLLFFTLFFTQFFPKKPPGYHLFPVVLDGKMGYIDSSGKMIIEPIFWVAYEFSEGLAAARLNGTYGYINTSGQFVIPPQYDYATAFVDGLAIVYKNGKRFYINKQGYKPFQVAFPYISQFENGRAIVRSETGKYGLINRKGEVIVRPQYFRIHPFVDGTAVVFKNREAGAGSLVGIIDTMGNYIIPFGKYDKIADLSDGYFTVSVSGKKRQGVETTQYGLVNKKGMLVFLKELPDNSWIDGDVQEGLVKINLYKNWIASDDASFDTDLSYEGFMNLEGEVVINDTTFEYVYPFADHRAIVQSNGMRENMIIDRRGKNVSDLVFNKIIGNTFREGFALASLDHQYGVIDTHGQFIVRPQFNNVDYIGIVNGYFFFSNLKEPTFEDVLELIKADPDYFEKRKPEKEMFGIAKVDGTIVSKAIMDDFDRRGFQNGLLHCTVDGAMTYINENGRIIWQSLPSASVQLQNLNIDYMARGYYYATSKMHDRDPGGFGGSNNTAHEIVPSANLPSNKLSVIIRPESRDTFFDYNGMTVMVANTTGVDIEFPAQDSRLYMKVQAKNSLNKWQDIEYIPGSWCGNSYHTLTLEPNQYWQFVMPVYEGDIKTKLRIELEHYQVQNNLERRRKYIKVFSAEVDGSVNAAQFWRKREYSPTNIMDPYLE